MVDWILAWSKRISWIFLRCIYQQSVQLIKKLAHTQTRIRRISHFLPSAHLLLTRHFIYALDVILFDLRIIKHQSIPETKNLRERKKIALGWIEQNPRLDARANKCLDRPSFWSMRRKKFNPNFPLSHRRKARPVQIVCPYPNKNIAMPQPNLGFLSAGRTCEKARHRQHWDTMSRKYGSNPTGDHDPNPSAGLME